MQKLLRWFAVTLGVLVTLAVLAVGVVYAMSERVLRARHPVDTPPFTLALPDDSASLAEGRRIAYTRGCQGCHGPDLGGEVFLSEPYVATVIAPNLTTLVRQRTDDELERALRHGVRQDGTALFVMPSEMLRSLRDDDMARLFAWLRSLPEVDGQRAERTLGPLGRLGLALGQFKPSTWYVQHETVLPAPADSALLLGHYVATSSCTECHGNDMRGFDDAPSLVAIAPAYSREEFAEFLRTGIAKGNRELPMMTGVARGRFVHFTTDEMDGLYAYLRSLGAPGGD